MPACALTTALGSNTAPLTCGGGGGGWGGAGRWEGGGKGRSGARAGTGAGRRCAHWCAARRSTHLLGDQLHQVVHLALGLHDHRLGGGRGLALGLHRPVDRHASRVVAAVLEAAQAIKQRVQDVLVAVADLRQVRWAGGRGVGGGEGRAAVGGGRRRGCLQIPRCCSCRGSSHRRSRSQRCLWHGRGKGGVRARSVYTDWHGRSVCSRVTSPSPSAATCTPLQLTTHGVARVAGWWRERGERPAR